MGQDKLDNLGEFDYQYEEDLERQMSLFRCIRDVGERVVAGAYHILSSFLNNLEYSPIKQTNFRKIE